MDLACSTRRQTQAEITCAWRASPAKVRPPSPCPWRRSVGLKRSRRKIWWAMTGSNRRHLRCKRSALPTELIALVQPCRLGGWLLRCKGKPPARPRSRPHPRLAGRGRSRGAPACRISRLFRLTAQGIPLNPRPRRDGLRSPRWSAGVAQSVRVPACHAGGRGFEPRHSRQFRFLSQGSRARISPEDCSGYRQRFRVFGPTDAARLSGLQ